MTARLNIATISIFAGGGLLLVLLVMLGPDYFYAIPWPIRRALGQASFAGLVIYLGYRLLPPRARDSLPLADDQQGPSPRWLAWSGLGMVLALAFASLQHPENLGFGDWDLFLTKHEAARRTIVLWGQFPWWDPWTRGGFPLAANPQCGVSGVAMPLVLAFGTSVGMRLATLICFYLAFEGARRLARLWLGDPYAAALAGLIYGLNGGVFVASVAAYHLSMCYPVLPWMLYLVFRLERQRSAGFWLGFWAAFNVLNGIQYFTVYTFLIAGLAWLRALMTQAAGPMRRRFLAHTLIAAATFFALAGWRLATTGLVYRDFPRPYATAFAESPLSILYHLCKRPTATFLASTELSYFWETTCYVGPIVLILGAISLIRGWRGWHTLALLCGWLASGTINWYHPSFWLAYLPVFSTMHVVTRWRFMAVLGLALAAASVIAALRKDGRTGRRVLAYVLMIVIAADYLAYGYEVLPVAFSIAPDEARFPGPPRPPGEIVQIDQWPGFAAVLRGYGVIHGFEPLMGYDRQSVTSRTYESKPDYVAEHWTARGPARVISWSPNRIELQVEPGELTFINQNPGSWWWVNGRPAFEEMRCAEPRQAFAVNADDQGRIVLEIRPRGLKEGLLIQLAGFAVLIATWLVLRRADRTIRDGNGS